MGWIEVDGLRVTAALRVSFDGIEYVGRLSFHGQGVGRGEVVDRAALPGRSPDEAVARARSLTAAELERRYRRAVSEKRRYTSLRHATEIILERIRYLNQVALSVQAGLLNADAAALEIDAIEAELHDLVRQLPGVAGLPSNEEGGLQ